MVPLLLLAGLAGFASALLSGMLVPGVTAFAFLFMLAPLPLFILAFGWHPLAGALAGLFGAILIDLSTGNRAALGFASLFALPAYALPLAAERAFAPEAREKRRAGIALGHFAQLMVGYLASVVVVSALWAEPDHARFVSRLQDFAREGLRQMAGPGPSPLADPAIFERMVEMMSAIMLPVSGFLVFLTVILCAALGAIIADRSGRMAYARPAFSLFRLPGGSLILLGIALFTAMQEGYVGVFAEIFALSLALLLMLQGLAVLHARLEGREGRGLMLSAAWGSILIFGLPALLFLGIGVADHLFDLRKEKRG